MSQGFSRRELGRVTALIGASSALAAFSPNEGNATSPDAVDGTGLVEIGANECWTGPFDAGCAAAVQAVANANRYDPAHSRNRLIQTVASVENLPTDRIQTWPGSCDPLVRAVVTFCSPERCLVTADPTFEAPWNAATWLGAPIAKVPLAPGEGVDTRAMLAAAPAAGLYYVCTPNNPTGTITPLADIEWLVLNKPAGSIVVVDEAYIHFSSAASAIRLAASRRDVMVLRTFSKLFGMAGMRLGLSFAHPELHGRMTRYDGKQVTEKLPLPAVACGTAVYGMSASIRQRRSEMISVRESTISRLRASGLAVHPGSEANMFMVDWKGTAGSQMQRALLDHGVRIGRSWPVWPTASRISVGSSLEMNAFCSAVEAIIA